MSTVIRLKSSPLLDNGEVKPGDGSISNHSLCVDTMKPAALSRNVAQKTINQLFLSTIEFHLIFFVMQGLDHHLHIILEISRIAVLSSLATLYPFIASKNLSMLLRMAFIFWNCCINDIPTWASASPCKLQGITTLFAMTNKYSSKARECTISYD